MTNLNRLRTATQYQEWRTT